MTMNLKKIMSNYADYNLWVNQHFVNWLSPKSDELLYAEVPSSFSTIVKTLDQKRNRKANCRKKKSLQAY
jgi:uncharacterized damage-inducible protein DinB